MAEVITHAETCDVDKRFVNVTTYFSIIENVTKTWRFFVSRKHFIFSMVIIFAVF